MFYIMRLYALKEMKEFKELPNLPKDSFWAKMVGYYKVDDTFFSVKFILISVFLGIVLSCGQTVLSLFFVEWFGLSRILSLYVIALSTMLIFFTFAFTAKIKVKGMSKSLSKNLDSACVWMALSFVLILVLSLFGEQNNSSMIVTIEFISLIFGFISIFFERGFNPILQNNVQAKELKEVRQINLKLMKLRKQVEKNKTPSSMQIKDSIDFVYEKSSLMEVELTKHLHV